jgi:branched-chain amino acid transport system substrate-binding protein
MRAPKPSAYVAIVYAHEGGLLLRQARELGLGEQFFGADPWTKHDFLESAGEAADGALFTTPALYNGPEFETFAQKYRGRYHQDPGIYESHGYDCMMLLFRAIRAAGESPQAIRDSLAETKGYKGVTGETTFDVNGDVPTKGFVRVEWKAGARVRLN